MKKDISAPEVKKDAILNILIIGLLFSIIIISIGSFWFRTHLYDRKDFFSEVYFTDPVALPNKVKVNTDYSYTFSIKSDENETKNLTYVTGIELYDLYDIIQSRYACLNNFQSRLYLEWSNDTKNFTLLKPAKKINEIETLIAFPNYEKKISWNSYTMEFGFDPPTFAGQLVIFFGDEANVKYYITLDEASNKTYFNQKLEKTGLDLHKDNNKVRISVENNSISFYLNNRFIFNEKYIDLYNGDFGFETQDNYVVISGFQVYKNDRIVIPAADSLYSYNLDERYVQTRISDLTSLRSRSIPIQTDYKSWNETIDCIKDPFYCKFFDLANDISFTLEGTNISKIVDRIPVAEEYANYVISPSDVNSSLIDWKNFTISFKHNQIKAGDRGEIIFQFGNNWAIMMTRNNSYFIRPVGEYTEIDEIRNPRKANSTQDNISIAVTKDNIVLYINNDTVFAKQSPKDFTNGYPQLIVKNAFIFVDTIKIKNQDPACNDPYRLQYCDLTLQTGYTNRQSTSQERDDFTITSIDYQNTERNFNLFEYSQNNSFQVNISTSNISESNATINLTIKQPVKQTLNVPLYNPFIPDRLIVLNKPSTIIENSSNFSMGYSYQALDGARVMQLGLLDFNGNEMVSMSVLERQNKIIIYSYDGKVSTANIDLPINQSIAHSLNIDVQKDNIAFSFDYHIIYEQKRANTTSGQFYIGSRNTYFDMGNINLNIRDKRYYKTLSLNENPCDLKLIYKEDYSKEIFLSPDSSVNITNSFNINRNFDYGKVFVELYGSGNMTEGEPLEIHFWVIRDDN